MGIGLQFPALVMDMIGVDLAAMQTSCCGSTLLFPTFQFLGGR